MERMGIPLWRRYREEAQDNGMKRMGIPLWRRSYREAAWDNAYRVPVTHSGAAAVGKSHKTSLGNVSLKKARLCINPPSPEGMYLSTTKIFLERSQTNSGYHSVGFFSVLLTSST